MKSNDDPGVIYARCLAEEQGHLGRLRRWLTWLVRVRIADLTRTPQLGRLGGRVPGLPA